MTIKLDYSEIKFRNNGKLKLLIIVGTRPEIIRLAAVINKCRTYFDCVLAHTGQNYDYNLNGVFFRELKLADPEIYMDAVGDDLGATIGNIINCSYKLISATKPDALLILGDTNSCLSAISAKRLHVPIFHMEAGNRCKDECLPEETNRRIVDIISDVNLCYSEHARRYLIENGLPKERIYVTGSPMAEVLHESIKDIDASEIHKKLGLKKGHYILLLGEAVRLHKCHYCSQSGGLFFLALRFAFLRLYKRDFSLYHLQLTLNRYLLKKARQKTAVQFPLANKRLVLCSHILANKGLIDIPCWYTNLFHSLLLLAVKYFLIPPFCLCRVPFLSLLRRYTN